MDIITKDTGIIDAVQQHPEILEVFAKYVHTHGDELK